MAKNKKASNDDVLASAPALGDITETENFIPDQDLKEETGLDEETGFYALGTIVNDDEEDAIDEEVRKAAKSMKKGVAMEDEDSEEITDDDLEYNTQDVDTFLDEEDKEWDDFANEDDDYSV